MITKISGIVDDITSSSVIVEIGGLYYSVLMAPVMIDELNKTHRKGDTVVLYTHYYIEGSVGIGNLIPRLIGFFSEEDRKFFEIFTTVKGLGEKKALQALTIPIGRVASAVENGDIVSLKSLPGIGGRMAEKVVAELRGKMARFADIDRPEAAVSVREKTLPFEQQAVDILITQLGYRRIEAEKLIDKALKDDPDVASVEELIQSVYKQKLSVENA